MAGDATINVEARIAAIQSAIHNKDFDKALKLCESLTQDIPTEIQGYGLAAVALRNMGKIDASHAMVWKSIKAVGLRPVHLVTMADTAMDFRDWDQAAQRWRDLRLAFPKMRKGYFQAAVALKNAEKYDTCDAMLHEMWMRFDKRPGDLVLWAESAFDRGNWDVAAERYNEMRLQFPDEPAGYMGGIKTLKHLKESRGLKSLFRLEEKDDPTNQFADKFYSLSIRKSLPLQELISRARTLYDLEATSPLTTGANRLFDLAQKDMRLAAILRGQTQAPRALTPGRKIRALFYFPTVTQTDNLMPLLEHMGGDDRFEPIILCSRNKNAAILDSFAFFSEKYPADKGYTVVDGGEHVNSNLSIYELDADIVFYHTPYSAHGRTPFFLRADFVARHTRVAHISYGYFLMTLEAGADHIYSNTHTHACDLVFSESDISDSVYRRVFAPEKVHLTGYPKFDAFRKVLDETPFEERVAGKDILDVVWTPHWQTREDPTGGTHTSNFTRYLETMIALSSRSDVRLHVRPHPLLRLRFDMIGLNSVQEYDAIMDRFTANGAVVYPADAGVSYVDVLMNADVLISDFSSLLTEFFIARRPIIFCRTDEVWNNGEWIGDFGQELISKGTYIVDSMQEMLATLDTIIVNRKHPRKPGMDDLIATHNLFPEGSACARICDVIAGKLAAA